MQINSSSMTVLPKVTGSTAASTKTDSISSSSPVDSGSDNPVGDAPASPQNFSDVGKSVRAKLNAIYSEGAKSGTRIVYDTKDGGKFPDVSDWSDQDLAAMALGRDKSFTKDEKVFAEAELNKRLAVALEPFSAATMSGDRRGQAMAINMLYSGMSQEVRAAMNFTPAMMASNNSMLEGDNKLYGALDNQSVLRTLLGTKANGRPTDVSFLEAKLSTLTYSPASIGAIQTKL